MNVSLNKFYQVIGISKQGFHQRMNRQLAEKAHDHQLLYLVYQLRADHPTMGCRDMYYKLKPEYIGRDRFERFCKLHELASQLPRNYRRTTDSSGVVRFDNLTIGLVLYHINQLWVSDITYFDIGNKTSYITFIMDAYSRRIIGHHTSKRLFTEQTSLPTLEMALQLRGGKPLDGTIFHSDGGGQYYDTNFLATTKAFNLSNSMCQYPWENGKAERINGVIKNNYLIHRDINSFETLKKEVDRAVQLYNEEKPHKALKRVSPVSFEKDYLRSGKITDAEKSTTEYEIHNCRANNSPAGCGKITSASNITQEYV